MAGDTACGADAADAGVAVAVNLVACAQRIVLRDFPLYRRRLACRMRGSNVQTPVQNFAPAIMYA